MFREVILQLLDKVMVDIKIYSVETSNIRRGLALVMNKFVYHYMINLLYPQQLGTGTRYEQKNGRNM